jgi:hypothetical protein
MRSADGSISLLKARFTLAVLLTEEQTPAASASHYLHMKKGDRSRGRLLSRIKL